MPTADCEECWKEDDHEKDDDCGDEFCDHPTPQPHPSPEPCHNCPVPSPKPKPPCQGGSCTVGGVLVVRAVWRTGCPLKVNTVTKDAGVPGFYPTALLLCIVFALQEVTVITKIIIIKKYKCESDSWSCKGGDYCDVRTTARNLASLCCWLLMRRAPSCPLLTGQLLARLLSSASRFKTAYPPLTLLCTAGRQGVGLPRGHQVRPQLGWKRW